MEPPDRGHGAPVTAEMAEAEQHLDRFLLWVAVAAVAFGLPEIACAIVFRSWQLAVAGLGGIALVPLTLAGRGALSRGRPDLATIVAVGGLLLATTPGGLLLPQLDVVVPVALMSVLMAAPLARSRTLAFVFGCALAWAVGMSFLRLFASAPSTIPGWFSDALNVAIVAAATPLALFLLRNFHRRLTALLVSARAAETQYRTLVEQLPAITFVDMVTDGDPFEITPLYVSPQVESILGYPADRWLSDASFWRAILHPEDRVAAIALSAETYERRTSYATEYRLVAADGRIVWIEEASVIIPGSGDQPTVWQGVMFDITARREAEEERNRSVDLLRRADAQRRELLADLVSAQEAERKRLANDIHDDPVQKMTAVGLRLGSLLRTLDDPEQIRIVQHLQATVELSIARLRGMMFELRPPALDRGDLVAAVRDLVSEMSDAVPICRIEDQLVREPPEETRTVAYRIAAEALANVRRHSGASEVQVLFAERDGGLFLRIRDDGVGISAETIAGGRSGHLGLTSIRERAEAAGGWSRIEAGVSGGTVVEAWLPMAQVEAVRSA